MALQLLQQPLFIDDVQIRNRVFLAPMSGVSDLPFRRLAWQAGAGMVVSEMVASAELCRGQAESMVRLQGEGLGLHVVQLAGRDAHWMGEAARLVEAHGANMIDINMGCPAKKVIGGYSGAALMRDMPLALSLIEAVVKAVSIPVTLKMRLGWDDEHLNAPELALEAQNAGVKMITVHGRTRMQFYNGCANWDAIKRVRDVIEVPLVANGDVATQEDAFEIMCRSGADAVMIGRASYGQPWLCGALAGFSAPDNLLHYIANHYQAMLIHYGEKTGPRHARKHLDWYLARHAAGLYSADERVCLLTMQKPEEVMEQFQRILARKQDVKVA